MKNLSGQEKFEIYFLANQLLNDGHSHPTVVGMIKEYLETINTQIDESEISWITEKAIKEQWHQLVERGKYLFSIGKTYADIKKELALIEDDRDIIDFVVDDLYAAKTEEIEAISDARDMKSMGLEGMAKYGLGAILLFIWSSNVFVKTIWAIIFVVSLFIFISGILSSRKAKKINKAFKNE